MKKRLKSNVKYTDIPKEVKTAKGLWLRKNLRKIEKLSKTIYICFIFTEI